MQNVKVKSSNSNSKSRRYLRWLVFGSSTPPSLYLSPGGREYTVTLSLRERVAKGRVRAFVASILAALISSLI
jgi:DNA-binding transcriptional regulator PaaX